MHINKVDTEKDLNLKILSITLGIKKFYPELSIFLDEMPLIQTNTMDSRITVELLNAHYISLKAMLSSYLLEKITMEKINIRW